MTVALGELPHGRASRWRDPAVAAGFAAVMVPIHLSVGGWTVAAVLLLAAALGVRRVSLPLMVACALAAAVTQVGSLHIAFLADTAYAVLFFTLGAHQSERWRRFGLGAAVTAAVVAGLAMVPYLGGLGVQPTDGMGASAIVVAVLTAVVTVGGWGAGYLRLQNRRALQARIDAQLAEGEQRRLRAAVEEQEERARIATEMHDVVAHSWAVVAVQADGARYAMAHSRDQSPDQVGAALDVIAETARAAIGDMRTILARLRYQETDETVPGPEQQAALLDRMRASGMHLEVEETGERTTSPMLALTVHRILGESLTNALKHADLGRPVVVRLHWHGGARLVVSNALGKDAATTVERTGHGIIGMTERARAIGGTLQCGPAEGRWRVDVDLPAIERAGGDT